MGLKIVPQSPDFTVRPMDECPLTVCIKVVSMEFVLSKISGSLKSAKSLRARFTRHKI